jgi:glycosyltransferase involved in cell wall biosynthesis
MVLPVPAMRTRPGGFEIESAFAEHLRMLRRELGTVAQPLVIACPELPPDHTTKVGGRWVEIDEKREGILFRPMFPLLVGRFDYLRWLPSVLVALRREIAEADVVHSGLSTLYRPFELPALLMAAAMGKKTISVTDIDNRTSARMNYLAGRWSKRDLWVTRLLHEPFMHLQQKAYVRFCSLVLLKGQGLVEDYGRGRKNVKYFLDAAFSAEQILDADRAERKIAEVAAGFGPLRLTYFGRLTPYKGVDFMLRAIRRARDQGANLRFEIIGKGESEDELRALTTSLDLDDQVTFAGALAFGPELFSRLYNAHVLLAAPMSQDTPRSALDACAAGQAIVAFDTYYYAELAGMGAPVKLVPWLDSKAFGAALVQLDKHRDETATMLRSALRFARANTQESWISRRVAWTQDVLEGGGVPQLATGAKGSALH